MSSFSLFLPGSLIGFPQFVKGGRGETQSQQIRLPLIRLARFPRDLLFLRAISATNFIRTSLRSAVSGKGVSPLSILVGIDISACSGVFLILYLCTVLQLGATIHNKRDKCPLSVAICVHAENPITMSIHEVKYSPNLCFGCYLLNSCVRVSSSGQHLPFGSFLVLLLPLPFCSLLLLLLPSSNLASFRRSLFQKLDVIDADDATDLDGFATDSARSSLVGRGGDDVATRPPGPPLDTT